ncbi:MAG: hypothetical protein M9932_02065 [Xanthobacteraceae bacterium]|nr:hypothetical protein [Xanthobacteraceae bacterium]
MSRPLKATSSNPLIDLIDDMRKDVESGATPPQSSVELINSMIQAIRARKAELRAQREQVEPAKKGCSNKRADPRPTLDDAVDAAIRLIRTNGRKRAGIPSAEIIPFPIA